MSSTRAQTKVSRSAKCDELLNKVNSSKINAEVKEIFKLFVTLFSSLQLERESTISGLRDKLETLESKYTELVDKIESHDDAISNLNNKMSVEKK